MWTIYVGIYEHMPSMIENVRYDVVAIRVVHR